MDLSNLIIETSPEADTSGVDAAPDANMRRAVRRLSAIVEETIESHEPILHDLEQEAADSYSRIHEMLEILDANPALIRLLGFPSRESLMAVNLRDIHADAKSRRLFLERLEREGEVQDVDIEWKRYGGQIITVRQSARTVREA